MTNQSPGVPASPTIAVLTATLNAADVIGTLASDLAAQTDPQFDWIVADGGSTDNTVDLIHQHMGKRAVLIQERDFGIYDALNKALRHCLSDYYLVLGADDRLDKSAIGKYRQLAHQSSADIIAASVYDNGGVARPGRGMSWLRGQNAYISHHSVGTLIRRDLHQRFGLYSSAFPIAADQFFVKTAVRHGCRVHCAPDFVAGEFGRGGVSTRRYLQCQFEYTLVQMRTERHRAVQLLLLAARVIRHWREALR